MNKEKLEQQIEEMKSKLAEMEAELSKPKKFEWKYKYGTPYIDHILIREGTGCSTQLIEHGRYRKTQANAERALERNRLGNRLEALVEQLGNYGTSEWGDKNKAHIFYNITTNKYGFRNSYMRIDIGQVYMSEEVAIKICSMLNNGEIEL